MNFSAGEVVLVSFPYSGLTGMRRRPALVLLDVGDDDVVVARITSQAIRDAFDVELIEWQEAGLLLPSITRLHKLATLEKDLVERRLGILTAGDRMRVRLILERLWGDL